MGPVTSSAENGQLGERKVHAVLVLLPGTSDDAADAGAVNAKEAGDVCGRAACVQHGEDCGLLLGRELGLAPAATALGAC